MAGYPHAIGIAPDSLEERIEMNRIKRPWFVSLLGSNTTFSKVALSVTFVVMVLSACSQSRTKARPGEENEGVSPFQWIETENGHLGWDDLRIGMSRKGVAEILRQELSLHRGESPVCGEFFSDVLYHGRWLALQFSSTDEEAELESIFVPFKSTLQSKAILVQSLKEYVPDLTYQPSQHQPNQPEQANRTPMYLVDTNPNLAILLKPDRGFYLSLRDCLD